LQTGASSASPLGSPALTLREYRIKASWHAAKSLSCSGPDARDGLLLARNSLRLRGFHSGVKAPGLPLRFLASRFGCPLTFPLCRWIRLAPFPAASLLQARCSLADLLDEPRLRSPLPFGTFTSLWIEAFRRLRADQSTFRIRPISSRSPLPCSITSCGSGSSFQVRYVSGGLLFLKPLGTSFTMLPRTVFVNAFVFLISHFPRYLWRCVSKRLRRCHGEFAVDKSPA